MVWAFAVGAPLLGAAIATRIPERFTPRAPTGERVPWLAREAVRPGIALSLGVVGFAAVAAFLVLHLDARGIGHGAETFAAFAATVVLVRLLGGDLPDRVGPVPCALGAALIEALGLALIGLAESAPVAIAGAMIMGGAYSTLYPALALIVVDQVGEDRRGVALGTFTACFDLGVGLGSPLVGAFATAAGYSAAFYVGAVCALGAAAVAAFTLPRVAARGQPAPA
jgi:predicted MFS family arabinose efflux permease